MALFVLGDPHLSLGASKPMDIFPGWNDYVERLEKNWRKLIQPEDTIVLAGDISWAMRLTDTRRDFAFLQSLPGQKIIMKGNHDYWWSTANKMNAYLKAEGFDTLHILHNNSYSVEGYAICGTRGWLFDVGEPHDEKVMNREIGRLRMSLDAAEPGLEKLVFLHYPPVYTGISAPEIVATLKEYGIMPQSIASISTIKAKSDEPVVKALQKKFPVYFYTAEELAEIEVPHPSKTVMKHMGTPSVSEAAALLSANNSRLLVPKKKGENYTVAAALDIRTVRQGHIEIVGAGPGDPDLVSVRGRQMLERADLILYAGSLVPKELTLCAKAGATVLSSASMDLEEQFEVMKKFYDKGKFIVRLHTGDPCIYGAIQEQMNYFDQHGMSYHITPGISSFQAAAAALKSQFTIPEKVQSIILTRGEGRTPMPEKEQLHKLAQSQSTMCIFLSAGVVEKVQEELSRHYAPTTPVAACYKLTWKDERIYRGQLKDLAKIVKENHLTLTTLLVVGDAIDNRKGLSRLYADEFKHLFRK